MGSGFSRASKIDSPQPLAAFVAKLERRDRLAADEVAALHALPVRTKHFAKGQEIIRYGDKPTSSTAMVHGFSGRTRELASGQRQILAFHIPGDFVDLHSFLLKEMDHAVLAVTDCEVGFVAHDDLRRLQETMPHLTRLLWLSTLLDAAVTREWLLSLGSRPALERTALLFCELYMRLDVVGLCRSDEYRLPVTQAELGEFLGLSTVHVNRMMQELRARDALDWRRGTVRVLDWTKLCELAGFDSTYLHLDRLPR